MCAGGSIWSYVALMGGRGDENLHSFEQESGKGKASTKTQGTGCGFVDLKT
jgi:hypothetical protein